MSVSVFSFPPSPLPIQAPNMAIKEPGSLKRMVMSATYRDLGLPCLPDDGHPYHHLRLLKKYEGVVGGEGGKGRKGKRWEGEEGESEVLN